MLAQLKTVRPPSVTDMPALPMVVAGQAAAVGAGSAAREAIPRARADARPAAPRGERPSKGALEAALAQQGGNVRATAIALGIGRKTLYRWVEAAGIDVGSIRDGGEDGP